MVGKGIFIYPYSQLQEDLGGIVNGHTAAL